MFWFDRINSKSFNNVFSLHFQPDHVWLYYVDTCLKIVYLHLQSIYKFGLSWCLFVCLSVCLYPINVKTAEPIGPNFFVGHHVNTGKVYEWSKFQIFVSIKIRSSSNFWKFWKSTKIFVKIREFFLFCFTMCTQREHVHN